MNEYDERAWNTRSRSFLGLLHRVNTFVINFNFIYYSSCKLSKVQNVSYLRSVERDDMSSKDLCIGQEGA